jgi:hypothetical protein
LAAGAVSTVVLPVQTAAVVLPALAAEVAVAVVVAAAPVAAEGGNDEFHKSYEIIVRNHFCAFLCRVAGNLPADYGCARQCSSNVSYTSSRSGCAHQRGG